MSDIILTEAEFAALRSVVEEAQATTQRFGWLSGTARRITRDDILLPRLHTALEGVKTIDFENPRRMEAAHADAQQQRTRPAKK